ncbi:MAG: radical SAM protein, partial [Clostridia bacterium]
MILHITQKCFMNCNHCMMESSPNGEHMSLHTFAAALEFIKKIKPQLLVISGGEPTEHPYFFDILDECTKLMGLNRVVVTSNGMFLDNKKFTKRLINKKVQVQITNDRRFYPKNINKVANKRFTYTDRLESVTNYGRAKMNGIADKTNYAPKCYNILSVARQCDSLQETMQIIEGQIHKFCGLGIETDGQIRVGESIQCKKLGN